MKNVTSCFPSAKRYAVNYSNFCKLITIVEFAYEMLLSKIDRSCTHASDVVSVALPPQLKAATQRPAASAAS
uniref:Uncharacterized protein n=1 Tax=Onchocerca volvulus TaxID=6282 RepID=A0A8R1TYN5_ONCVO